MRRRTTTWERQPWPDAAAAGGVAVADGGEAAVGGGSDDASPCWNPGTFCCDPYQAPQGPSPPCCPKFARGSDRPKSANPSLSSSEVEVDAGGEVGKAASLRSPAKRLGRAKVSPCRPPSCD